LGGEMQRFINMFSAPARPVLDELFDDELSRESPVLPPAPKAALEHIFVSQKV
jgi:hypothetical protein